MSREVFARVCAHPSASTGSGEGIRLLWGEQAAKPWGCSGGAGWSRAALSYLQPPELWAEDCVLSPAGRVAGTGL